MKLHARGYRVTIVPTAQLYHYESFLREKDIKGDNVRRFTKERGDFHESMARVLSEGLKIENPNLEFGNTYEKIDWSIPAKGLNGSSIKQGYNSLHLCLLNEVIAAIRPTVSDVG